MAETRVATGANPQTVPAEPKKKSPVRTLILFGILLLVIAAYAHDYFVAAPAAKAADEKIHALVAERNAQGVKEGTLVKSQDIRDLLGKEPSKVTEGKGYTEEVYRYWGGMLPQRQYISVLYFGPDDNRRYHVHYLNTMPEKDDYPSDVKIPEAPAGKSDEGDAEVSGSSSPAGVRSETEAPASDEANPPGTDAPAESEPAAPATESPASESPATDSTGEKSEAAPE